MLLTGVIVVVAIVLTLELRTILFDEAQAKVDRVGDDIVQAVRGNSALGALGAGLPIEAELAATGSLDHWSGPTTYVEIDTPGGYPVNKSSNMGSVSFGRAAAEAAPQAVRYRTATLPLIGSVLVRDERVEYPGVALIVQVGESLEIYDRTLDRIRVLVLVVACLAAACVVAGSFAVASSALEPIARLGAAMGEIRSDRLSRRLGWTGRHDELGSLAQSFDAMLDRLEDGFARERQFISDASHELKTPLTVINANAQMLERWADREPAVRADSIRAIREESASLAAMVNGMLLLAKAESGDDIPQEPLDLAEIVRDAVRSVRPRAEEKGLQLAFAEPHQAAVAVRGDANLLRQVMTNLIENAVKFTERGSIDVALDASGTDVAVTVTDTGMGIEEDALERVFDRFYRTDASRQRAVPGTGLGLAIVRSIVRVHGGTVVAAGRPGGGTAVRVMLPMLTSRS